MLKLILKLLVGLCCIILLLLALICERDKPLETLMPLYTNPSSQFMPLMGMRVHYRDEGPRTDSVPLILLHGMSSSLHTWDSVALHLKAKRRVIALDLPGFGLTGPSPENTYNFDYYSRFLDSFAHQLQINRFILVGNSMGGAIAWNYALHQPRAVAKLILIDAAGYPPKGKSGSLGFRIASTPVINNLLLYATPKILIRKSLETIYYDQLRVTDAQVERFHDMAIREGNRAVALQIFKGSFGTTRNKGQIDQVTTPALILWGEQDNLISVEHAYQFGRDLKGSRVEIYPRVGHVPMEEVPGKVARSIENFIR